MVPKGKSLRAQLPKSRRDFEERYFQNLVAEQPYCFLKYAAAFSGAMVEISILAPSSKPAQVAVLGKMVQCQW